MPQNNQVIYQEIESLVRSTYFDQILSKQSECFLEFKTRNGHLSIRLNNDVEVLFGGYEKKKNGGMDIAQLDHYLALIQSGFARQGEVNMSDITIHSITKQGKIVYCTLCVKEYVKMGA